MIQAAETSSIRQHARANPSIKREEPEEEPERSGPSDHRGHAERQLEKETDDAVGTRGDASAPPTARPTE